MDTYDIEKCGRNNNQFLRKLVDDGILLRILSEEGKYSSKLCDRLRICLEDRVRTNGLSQREPLYPNEKSSNVQTVNEVSMTTNANYSNGCRCNTIAGSGDTSTIIQSKVDNSSSQMPSPIWITSLDSYNLKESSAHLPSSSSALPRCLKCTNTNDLPFSNVLRKTIDTKLVNYKKEKSEKRSTLKRMWCLTLLLITHVFCFPATLLNHLNENTIKNHRKTSTLTTKVSARLKSLIYILGIIGTVVFYIFTGFVVVRTFE